MDPDFIIIIIFTMQDSNKTFTSLYYCLFLMTVHMVHSPLLKFYSKP